MCDNCTRAYWKHAKEFNKALAGKSVDESRSKKEYDQAVRTCEDEKQEPVAVRDYWNKG